MAAGVPSGRVALDTIYGVGEIEMALTRAGKVASAGRETQHCVRLENWGAPEEKLVGSAEYAGMGLPSA